MKQNRIELLQDAHPELTEPEARRLLAISYLNHANYGKLNGSALQKAMDKDLRNYAETDISVLRTALEMLN